MSGPKTGPAPDTRRALLRACRNDGDRAARDRLVAEYLPLVSSLARRYAGRGEQLEDLVQVGSIGLLKAIDRFDFERGVEFTTYAVPTIVGELKRHFRDKVWPVRVPRPLQELYLQLSAQLEELTTTLGRSPTIPELSAATGVAEDDVIEALEVRFAFKLRSLSVGIEDDEGAEVPMVELIGDDEAAYETAENRLVLSDGLRRLDPRERVILHMRFYRGLTQSQIASEIGVSQMHVSRLIRKALVSLSGDLEAA